jgi:uncharacterized membrane protein YozB (DUF420 family)
LDLSFLPAINATINAGSALSLIAGLYFIKKRNINAHRRCMITATACSGLFLICYITHYVWRVMEQGGAHTPYNGHGWWKPAYYTMLLTHTLLAPTVPVFAIGLIRLALTDRIDKHRRIARIAWPIWLYVSATGILIYFMLFWFNPAPTLGSTPG